MSAADFAHFLAAHDSDLSPADRQTGILALGILDADEQGDLPETDEDDDLDDRAWTKAAVARLIREYNAGLAARA